MSAICTALTRSQFMRRTRTRRSPRARTPPRRCSTTTGSWPMTTRGLSAPGCGWGGTTSARPAPARPWSLRPRRRPTRLGSVRVTGKVPYPWFNDYQGDIDLIGQRKPQNYWRVVVNGFSALELLVERPTPPGTQQFAVWYCVLRRAAKLDVGRSQRPADDRPRLHAQATASRCCSTARQVATKTLAEADKRVATFSVPYAPGRADGDRQPERQAGRPQDNRHHRPGRRDPAHLRRRLAHDQPR